MINNFLLSYTESTKSEKYFTGTRKDKSLMLFSYIIIALENPLQIPLKSAWICWTFLRKGASVPGLT